MATLIRKRLMTLDAQGWQMICERESEVHIQLLLAAAVQHSALLGDFMRNVYARRQRQRRCCINRCSLGGRLAA